LISADKTKVHTTSIEARLELGGCTVQYKQLYMSTHICVDVPNKALPYKAMQCFFMIFQLFFQVFLSSQMPGCHINVFGEICYNDSASYIMNAT
jgi:hypothetical protein